MPDALNIIPPVVEEMCEEGQMEVESKHGSAQDDTLAACVQCLLQCFNPDSGKGQSNQNSANLWFFLYYFFSFPFWAKCKKKKKRKARAKTAPCPLASNPC